MLHTTQQIEPCYPVISGLRGVGGVIIISYSTTNLHTYFRKSVVVYPTHLDNVLITGFNHVQSEKHLTESYALSAGCERRQLQVW